jgi:hypothetical protein
MRTFLLAGAAALATMGLPASLGAQVAAAQPAPAAGADQPLPQTADEANAQAEAGPTTTTVVPPVDPGEPATVVTTHPGNVTAPPPQAYNKTYPVCTAQLQDDCQNPGEGGAPGRSRALGYGPGEPASESEASGG